jgi:magnesium-transporting ATPase (P-type)
MEANPYSSPSANLYGTASGAGTDAVAPGTIAQLAGTKPWVRFMSVLMWIMSALMILATCIMMFVAASGVMKSNGNTAFNAGMLVGTALYYGVLSFVVIYPALKLGKYANSIDKLMASRSTADLDAALTEQRRYWKFNGILVIVMLCFVVIGVIAMLALGFTAFKSGMPFPTR